MTASQHSPIARRHSSTQHYQTFDTPPPKSRGRPMSGISGSSAEESNNNPNQNHDGSEHSTSQSPLPKKQIAILAVIALAEQTALNSISPYLPDMASKFPEVQPGQVGVYVGAIASAFAIAQFVTNYFWGWMSDRIGRKPVILLGTILTAACFVAFGFCRTLWQAIVIQALMGAVNGNQALVSTCLGEITDRSNQSKAFAYLPVLYGLGGITGPLVGGLLTFKQNPFNKSEPNPYPYLAPNLLSAAILVLDFVLALIFLEESLDSPDPLPQWGRKIKSLFSWLWQFASHARRPSYVQSSHRARYLPVRRHTDESLADDSDLDSASIVSDQSRDRAELTRGAIFTRDTILLLVTYLIFQLGNVAFNSLYPIFAQAQPPVGRGFTPSEIGLSQGFVGVVTIVFQIFVFGKLRDKMGNRWSYRAGLFGFIIAFLLMPWVGYKDADSQGVTESSLLVAVEVCFVLLVKTVAAVGGLTSALLLVTNSAPDNAVLGALNGLAQTLSAGGRAVGPLLSGGLFSLCTNVRPKGEALAFGVFAIVSFVGFMLSFGIRGRSLEAEGWCSEDENDEDDDDDNDNFKSDDEEANHS